MAEELVKKLIELNRSSKDLLKKLEQFNTSFEKVVVNFGNMETILCHIKKVFTLYKDVVHLSHNKMENPSFDINS